MILYVQSLSDTTNTTNRPLSGGHSFFLVKKKGYLASVSPKESSTAAPLRRRPRSLVLGGSPDLSLSLSVCVCGIVLG